MRRLLPILALSALCVTAAVSQVSISRAFHVPAADSILSGLNSIRGANVGNDIDGDGRMEIAVTNYADAGHVHIFEVVGDDSLELVWSSPTVASGGGGSTPRYVIFGDLDNDGLGEVIFQSNNNGVYVFEWDGVMGSDNYGTSFSGLIGAANFASVNGNSEFMAVDDIDGDGQQELLMPQNASGSTQDGYYIIRGDGNWNTNDPGFSSFVTEYQALRPDLSVWGGGGSPYAMLPAQFDGTGNKEILVHNWNEKNVWVMTVPSANTYQISDTTRGKQNLTLTSTTPGFQGTDDYVALFGGVTADIDNDGREEVYLPTYNGSLGGPSRIHMIDYASGENTSEIDTFNVTELDLTSATGGSGLTTFGAGYGDIDGDGKKEIYTSTVYPYNLLSVEFQGGDKRNPANWTSSLLYAGETDMYTTITIRDSLGVLDTTYVVQSAFAGKIVARGLDLDGDSKEDIVLPYQATNDSTTVRNLTWNGTSMQYDTVTSKIANPKNWGFRVIEGSATTTGVEVKDWTVITPDNYVLEQNFPNPFNPSTTIRFSLPLQQRISLRVFDINGRVVRTLLNSETRPAGSVEVVWDGRNDAGQTVASGTYFYTLSWGNFAKTMKMTLLK